MSDITEEMLRDFRSSYAADENAQVLNAAMARVPFADLAFVPSTAAKLNGDFSIEIKTRGITAQQKSGRCWMFAAMNLLREKVAEKCSLKEFELSQNYLTFYDKLEKANNFLEMAVAHAGDPWNDRFQMYLMHGIDDGGYWCEAADLIDKYGCVPKSAFPESYQSDHTDAFMAKLNLLLRRDAVELRKMVRAGQDTAPRRREMLAKVYRAECIAFGEPVQTFDFEYRDKDGTFHSDRDLTPKQFYEKYIGIDIRDYVAVSDEPYSNRKINAPVEFHSACNMSGRNCRALAVSQGDLEKLCLKSLKGGDALWFACDALAFGTRKEGVWDPDSFRYEGLLGGVDFSMTKQERLESGSSAPNHAMLLSGVNLDAEGNPHRWKIENSWGKDAGRDGYFVCSEKYFQEYVYEAVVHKKYLTKTQLKNLEKPATIIDPWEED